MITRRACGDAVRTRGDFVADRGAEGDMPLAAARARRTRWAWAAACSRAPRGRRRWAWADIPAGYNTPTAWSQTVAKGCPQDSQKADGCRRAGRLRTELAHEQPTRRFFRIYASCSLFRIYASCSLPVAQRARAR